MARKKATRAIGEHRFRVTQMKVRKSHRVLTRLVKIIGPSLGSLGDNLDAKPTDGSAQLDGIASLFAGGLSAAVEKLTGNLGDEDLNWLVDEIRPGIERETDVEGSWVPMTDDLWDDSFAGELLSEFKLIAFVVEHNYSSFFSGLGGIEGVAAKLQTRRPSESKSPTTETPTSGGSS